MTKSFYFPAPLSHLGELPIDRLLVFQDPIPAAGDALLRAHDAQSKFGATQGHDGDTVTLGLSFDGSMGLFRRPVASRKKMRIKGGVTTKHLRRNASTRYLFPSVLLRGEFALMTRLARMVVSGLPHHVTQRGNRRKSIFFEDGDREIYRAFLGAGAQDGRGGVGLLPNARPCARYRKLCWQERSHSAEMGTRTRISSAESEGQRKGHGARDSQRN